MIHRHYSKLEEHMMKNKVLVIYGPRQVGKTTLIQNYLKGTCKKYKSETGDNILIREIFESENLNTILDFVQGVDLLFIDEAQKIPKIGLALKMLVDHLPDLEIIVTGSASFELAGQIGEPLTGRKQTLRLFPLSILELQKEYSRFELSNKELENILIYGSYPESITATNSKLKAEVITEITESYLLKDILELEKVKSSKILLDLLRLLAFQIGNEVSLTELATQIGIDYKTVARYLDIFEKAFVIYNLRGYSKNLRKEVTKKSKYYFYDNGIRNALIANFNPLNLRNDQGQLWENFLFMERVKRNSYLKQHCNYYFWRTWDQKEIDLLEEREGRLFAYEFKWSNKAKQSKKYKVPKDFIENYPESEFQVINQSNFFDFVIGVNN